MYRSTRGHYRRLSFCDAVLTGLAEDGGLLVPEALPDLSNRWPNWFGLPYHELAFQVLRELAEGYPEDRLKHCCQLAYGESYGAPVAPLSQVADRNLLELIHGPTLAFKDVALQLLGRFFEDLLEERQEDLNIVAATSGDTGSAAIYGLSVCPRVRLFVTHPKDRIADLQRLQMTTVVHDRVYNIAVAGSFDDCQKMVKDISTDLEFKSKFRIGAVNSINWARIAAQIVYYFAAYLQSEGAQDAVPAVFSVPTGNFGNILAGEYARRMGLPVACLVLASNQNDILPRFFDSGTYRRSTPHSTASPAMDIQIASNFERYLDLATNGDSDQVRTLMSEFQNSGSLSLTPPTDGSWRAYSCSDEDTLKTVKAVYEASGKLLDPHTATAWWALDQCWSELPTQAGKIVVSTAHPAKFPALLTDLVAPNEGQLIHPRLEALKSLPERLYELPAETEELKEFITGVS